MPKSNDITITISGRPGSGKTTMAKALTQFFESVGMSVVVKGEASEAEAFIKDGRKVLPSKLWTRTVTVQVQPE